MASTSPIFKGIVRERTIELEEQAGLPEGQSVAVTVQPLAEQRLPPGEGIRRSAGAWADDPAGLDKHLGQLRQARDQDRTPIEL